MAKFKSNASRKRFLALRNKRKYAVGGLTPATNMYGDNTIPYTSSTVYEESNPEYQAQLADELTAVQEDTSYQDDANAELNRQNKIEGYGMRAANMGLNKITNNVVEKGLEQGIEMPNSGDAKSMFAAGKDAFKAQRTINQGIKSTTKAIEGAQKLISEFDEANKVLIGEVEQEKPIVEQNIEIKESYQQFVALLNAYRKKLPSLLVENLGDEVVKITSSQSMR